MNLSKNRIVSIAATLAFAIFLVITVHQQNVYIGVPDLRSTFDDGSHYYISVVANTKNIENKKELAEQIVKMSRDNSFQSVKYSVDAKGYPQSLDVSVYHTENEIGKQDASFHFTYEPDDRNAGYDIYHNPEKYKLVID